MAVYRFLELLLIGASLVFPLTGALPVSQPALNGPSTPSMLSNDAIPRPPLLRDIPSPTETFHLVLTTSDADNRQVVTAHLFAVTADQCQRLWAQALPHEYGPRFALVTDRGSTLLLDEWINVASDYAIRLLDRQGETIAQYSFDDIVAVTERHRADVVALASQGFWLSGEPSLAPSGDLAIVPAAHGTLMVDLTNGELRFKD
jgi:hypothetical protein